MRDLRKKALEVAEAGRDGDEHLLHITDDELRRLLDTALVTRNPKTGVYEANIFSDIGHGFSNVVSSVADVGKSAFNKVLNPFSSENIFSKGPAAALFPLQNPDVQKAAGIAGGALLGAEGLGLGVPGVSTAATPGVGTAALLDPQSGPLGAAVEAAAPSGFADELGGLSDAELADILAGGTGSGDVLMGGSTAASTAAGGAAKGTGILDFLSKNKGMLIPGAVLGAQLLTKPKIPQVPNLENIAGDLRSGPVTQAEQQAATSLIPSLSTGKLPPGAESMVSNATNDAVGAIRAKYAQLGMSGSTAETQEISAAQSRGEAMRFQFATQATQTGLQAAGLVSSQDMSAAQIYQVIMDAQLQSDQALQNALSNFAFASALGSAFGK